MRPDQKYMPDFSRRDDDNDFDNDFNFGKENDNGNHNENDDINLIPFNTQLPYNVLTTGWIPVFIFDNAKSPTNISASMSATIPNSPMGISNPFGQQFTMPNLSNLGGNNLGTQNLNYAHNPMGGTTPGGQFTTPYYPTSNVQGFPSGYNPWSMMGTTPSSMMGDIDGTNPGSMTGAPGSFGGTSPGTMTGAPGPFGGTSPGTMTGAPGSFGGTSPGTMTGTPGSFGGISPGSMTGTPGSFGGTSPGSMTGTPGSFGGTSPGSMTGTPDSFGGTSPGTMTDTPDGFSGTTGNSTILDDDSTPYNINATNYMNPRQDINITEIIKNFDLDLDEDLDLTRVNSDKRIDDVFSNITQKHQEIVSLLKAYNIPFPIIKLLIRKIIKISLISGKRVEE